MTDLERLIQPYCENDIYLLKKISKSILLKLNEPLCEMDYADFYSIANMVLWQIAENYDKARNDNFDLVYRMCLKKRFKSEIRNRHRDKRRINFIAQSLDVYDEDKNGTLEECIASDFNLFDEVMRKSGVIYSDKMQLYRSKLSEKQKDMLDLLAVGNKPQTVRELLNMTVKEYNANQKIMKSYELLRILLDSCEMKSL